MLIDSNSTVFRNDRLGESDFLQRKEKDRF